MKKLSGFQNWIRNQGFCHFLKVTLLVFLDIAQDCSLGQCVTSIRAKPLKKKKKEYGPNWSRNDMFYSNVVERPLKLACFCYFETFYFQVFIQWELNWSSEWFVTLAWSVLWCWFYLTYQSLKFQFSNQISLFNFENLYGF